MTAEPIQSVLSRIMTSVQHPAARCPEAARLYREWCLSVPQIPGGSFTVQDGDPVADDQLQAIRARLGKDEGAARRYYRHVATCEVCRR